MEPKMEPLEPKLENRCLWHQFVCTDSDYLIEKKQQENPDPEGKSKSQVHKILFLQVVIVLF